jgi:hypothetical protein
MRFIAELHQDGGCDYTIRCGTKVVSLNAGDMDAACTEVEVLLAEEYSGERQLERVIIYEVAQSRVADVRAIYAGIEARRKAEALTAKELAERAQLAALRAKYGG